MPDSISSRSEIERAVGAVRAVLSVLAIVTVFTLRIARATTVGELLGPVAVLGVLVLTMLALLGGWRRLGSGPDRAARWATLGLHYVETLWFVALMFVVADAMPDEAWVVLVIPIVVASLRLSDTAVLGTWLVGAVGYLVGTQLVSGQSGTDGQTAVQRLGLLLAVAASVALLTRWLSDGWSAQAALTAEAEQRVERLGVIENSAEAMRAAKLTAIPDICLSSAILLGFEAATMASGPQVVATAGDGAVVPIDAAPEPPSADDVVEVTRWLGDAGEVIYSATVAEPTWEVVFTGWTRGVIDEPLARAFTQLVGNASNATEAALHLERARFKGDHDPLTGLANRGDLRRRLESAVAGDDLVAVVFVDLDHFKPVNDTHGHLVGDGLLVAIAKRLTNVTMGSQALVARYGGDEFVLLLEGESAVRRAAETAEEVRRTLAEPFVIGGIGLSISGSIGVALARGPLSADRLLEQADLGAYTAKRNGRDQVHITVLEGRAPAAGRVLETR